MSKLFDGITFLELPPDETGESFHPNFHVTKHYLTDGCWLAWLMGRHFHSCDEKVKLYAPPDFCRSVAMLWLEYAESLMEWRESDRVAAFNIAYAEVQITNWVRASKRLNGRHLWPVKNFEKKNVHFL